MGYLTWRQAKKARKEVRGLRRDLAAADESVEDARREGKRRQRYLELAYEHLAQEDKARLDALRDEHSGIYIGKNQAKALKITRKLPKGLGVKLTNDAWDEVAPR